METQDIWPSHKQAVYHCYQSYKSKMYMENVKWYILIWGSVDLNFSCLMTDEVRTFVSLTR